MDLREEDLDRDKLNKSPEYRHAVYAGRRATLVEYMRDKIDEGDWHAVSDAANDLRVLEAREQQRLIDEAP